MKTISHSLIQEMTQRLVAEFQPEQVILFGSRAWGTPDKDSDVDMMIIVSESDASEYERMVRAYESLGDLIVPTDVFVKTRAEFDFFRDVRASLEHRIAERGKVLYNRSQEIATRGSAP